MNEATKSLHNLIERDWNYRMETHPTRASSLGDMRFNDKWSDESLPAIQARRDQAIKTLQDLRAISPKDLSIEDQLNYRLFETEHEYEIGDFDTHWYLLPIGMAFGIQSTDQLADRLPFVKDKDYEDWIARLESFGTLMNQTIELLRQGMREKMLHPRIVMQRVPRQIERQIVDDPEDSGFYRPFQKEGVENFRERAKSVIANEIVPSYKKLYEFFTREYLPVCPEKIGCRNLPKGEELYPYFCKKYTTTEYTPDEIHQIGLDEVGRIRAEMEQTKARAGFTGTLAEFNASLRTDPRFYFKSGEELLTHVRALCKQIDPWMAKLFRILPRTPYGVEPVPEAIAPDTYMAYYEPAALDGSRAGTYRINTYRPEARPKYEMPALTIHEAVPGHHLQIARAMELDLPKFRRQGHWTAYLEGWALYSETLGEVMGFYDDPYTKHGQLTYEIWRAIRLVVDTGMHWRGWSREQALDYFKENAAKTEADIINEVDRYIGWPGQALAYKIGEIKVKQLRDRAKDQLKERYDIRDFHEILLKNGALPLNILQIIFEEWLTEQVNKS